MEGGVPTHNSLVGGFSGCLRVNYTICNNVVREQSQRYRILCIVVLGEVDFIGDLLGGVWELGGVLRGKGDYLTLGVLRSGGG